MMFGYLKKFDSRLSILALGWLVSAIGFSLSIPFLSLYFHSELGLSLSSVGLFFGLTAIIRATFHAIGGELSDRLGRYRMMVLAQFCRAISFIGLAYSIYHNSGFIQVGLFTIMNAVFGAFFQPAANAAVADLVEKERRTEGYALVRIAGNLGWAIGPAIGGFIAAGSYFILFIVSGIMTLLSCIVVAIFMRGIRNKKYNDDKFSVKDFISIRHDRALLKHIILVFILYLVIAQIMAPLALYSVDLVGLTKYQLGTLYTLNGLMVVFFQLPATRLMKPVRLTSQLAIGAAIYVAAYIMVGLSSMYIFFLLSMMVYSIGELFVSPPALTITANLAPDGKTGRYMGFYGLSVVGGWSLGPLIGSVLLDVLKPDYFHMWLIVAFLALLASIGFRMMSRVISPDLDIYSGGK